MFHYVTVSPMNDRLSNSSRQRHPVSLSRDLIGIDSADCSNLPWSAAIVIIYRVPVIDERYDVEVKTVCATHASRLS